ncbi:hypothetical protein [Thermomonas sp.]|uniref:hypothetical protein n=1 Tax=Thermomonas sp. TaxID=1971895 RepID=UPI00321F62E2
MLVEARSVERATRGRCGRVTDALGLGDAEAAAAGAGDGDASGADIGAVVAIDAAPGRNARVASSEFWLLFDFSALTIESTLGSLLCGVLCANTAPEAANKAIASVLRAQILTLISNPPDTVALGHIWSRASHLHDRSTGCIRNDRRKEVMPLNALTCSRLANGTTTAGPHCGKSIQMNRN